MLVLCTRMIKYGLKQTYFQIHKTITTWLQLILEPSGGFEGSDCMMFADRLREVLQSDVEENSYDSSPLGGSTCLG